MSKPYTADDLSTIFDQDLIWRRKELSDMKTAVRAADLVSKSPLLRAIIAMSYAHWEGYIRTCATRYFEYLTLRKKPFVELERQLYVNSMLGRLEQLGQSRLGLSGRCAIVNEILDGVSGRFSYLSPSLVDTRSNLSTDVLQDICVVCGVDGKYFEEYRTFLDVLLLKRRNAIAHGQQEYIQESEVDDHVAMTLSLMGAFRNLLENKVYTKAYAA